MPVEITNSIGMKLVLIPPGEFEMGSPKELIEEELKASNIEEARVQEEYKDRLPNEGPQHRVRITKPFYLGVTEVTQEEYQRVIAENPSEFCATGNGKEKIAGEDTKRFPVENLKWHDAVEFCRRLSELPEEKVVGRRYRLPSEAQWEYACRAGSQAKWHFGDEKARLGEYGWHMGNAGGKTHRVCQFKANPFGLYDMYGNAWEWCADWYYDKYYAVSPVDDPCGVDSGSDRVLRGGSWNSVPEACRSAHRDYHEPQGGHDCLCLRASLVLADMAAERAKMSRTAETAQPSAGSTTAPESKAKLTPADAKLLVPEAASMPNAEFDKLASGAEANPAKFDSQPLTLVLLSLKPDEAGRRNTAALDDFRFLGTPMPPQLAAAMWKSKSKGYATAIQPEFITDCKCSTEKYTATGTVSFWAEKLYSGKAEFVARRRDGAWCIEEFHLPGYGIKTTRGEDGKWKKSAREVASGTVSAPPPAIAPFDAKKAKEHQEVWAKHLGIPVEMTNSIGMKLVLITPGEFDMGSPKELIEEELKAHGDDQFYKDRLLSERSRHRVRITQPFYLGVYEVTQGEYERLMRKNPSEFCASGKWKDKVGGQNTKRFPVENVSWDDAVEFCNRLSELPEEKVAGRGYRLPTEAQWEYACRAGSTGRFSFSSGRDAIPKELDENALSDYGWFSDNSGRMSHAVGGKRPGAWGLYDMQGNVWEFCQDWYDKEYYTNATTDDPGGPPGGSLRVNRGGSWICSARGCRSAFRSHTEPGNCNDNMGFRVCLLLADTAAERVNMSRTTKTAQPSAGSTANKPSPAVERPNP